MKLIDKLSIGVLALVFIAIALRFVLVKVGPGQTGVVNREWTGGFDKQDYAPGYHMSVGPFHTWTIFDTTVQTLHMISKDDGTGNRLPPLVVKSVDGANVTLDVSVKYKIEKGKAWQILESQGPSQTLSAGYKRRVKDRVTNVLYKKLGTLPTEDFYRPEKREEVEKLMQDSLRTALVELHVELVDILLRDITFEESFEESIKKKALAGQNKELNKAQTIAAEFEGKTKRVESETEAKVVVINQEREKDLTTMKAENDRKVEGIRADYKKKVAETMSDADLYAAVKQADGTRLLKEAEAAGQTMRRQALAIKGAEIYAGLELLKGLNLGDMKISTQAVNPLDVEAMIERFGSK